MSSSETARAAIELDDVVKSFKRSAVRSLDGLRLSIERGERVAVTGPSGCGKSTMLHLVAALDHPTAGAIRVDGVDLASIRNLAEYRRSRIGMIFQFHYLFPQLSAMQNLEVALIGGQMPRSERRKRVLELLEAVDLSDRMFHSPAELSGGERQRVAIARSLANDPDIILADEPTANLDEASVHRVLDLFAHVQDRHRPTTMVIVTHDYRMIESADRVIRLSEGRVSA